MSDGGATRSLSADPNPDRVLAALFLRRADEAAFRSLYRRHTPALYPLVLRLVGGIERDAEELVQDTWLRAARRLGRFRWDSSLRTWLCGIAINCCRERRRRQRNESSSDGPLDLALIQPAAAPAGIQIDLERAIARLPDGYRHVLVLHDVEGYTHQEISGLLGIEIGTSKSQLAHARRAVRDWLAGGEWPPAPKSRSADGERR